MDAPLLGFPKVGAAYRPASTSRSVPPPHLSWVRVKRTQEKIQRQLELALDEEDFQIVGLLCREAHISLGQLVFTPGTLQKSSPTEIGAADSKRILRAYLDQVIPGRSNKEIRQLIDAVYNLAVKVQHRRTATKTDAQICAIAISALIELIEVLEN